MLKNSSDQVIRQGSTMLHDARTEGEGAQVKVAKGLQRSCTGKALRAGKALFCKVYRGDVCGDELAAKKASLKGSGKKVSLYLQPLRSSSCLPVMQRCKLYGKFES